MFSGLEDLIFMLVILNPFSQVLYLMELMNRLEPSRFRAIHFRASFLSFLAFSLFGLVGDFLLKEIFQVRLASLQIFGGLIMLFLAHRYITIGAGSNLLFRGNISDLAPRISLPYMVGPGTIWMSILLSKKYGPLFGILGICGVLVINFLVVVLYQRLHYAWEVKQETRYAGYVSILMRTNALFIGAVAVEMVVAGIETLFRNGGYDPEGLLRSSQLLQLLFVSTA